jgi:hypothetical protein
MRRGGTSSAERIEDGTPRHVRLLHRSSGRHHIHHATHPHWPAGDGVNALEEPHLELELQGAHLLRCGHAVAHVLGQTRVVRPSQLERHLPVMFPRHAEARDGTVKPVYVRHHALAIAVASLHGRRCRRSAWPYVGAAPA